MLLALDKIDRRRYIEAVKAEGWREERGSRGKGRSIYLPSALLSSSSLPLDHARLVRSAPQLHLLVQLGPIHLPTLMRSIVDD